MAAFWVRMKSPSRSAGTAPAGLMARYSGVWRWSRVRTSTSKSAAVHCSTMWSAVEEAPGEEESFMRVLGLEESREYGLRGGAGRSAGVQRCVVRAAERSQERETGQTGGLH